MPLCPDGDITGDTGEVEEEDGGRWWPGRVSDTLSRSSDIPRELKSSQNDGKAVMVDDTKRKRAGEERQTGKSTRRQEEILAGEA